MTPPSGIRRWVAYTTYEDELGMRESPDGDFVRFEDYQREISELRGLIERAERLLLGVLTNRSVPAADYHLWPKDVLALKPSASSALDSSSETASSIYREAAKCKHGWGPSAVTSCPYCEAPSEVTFDEKKIVHDLYSAYSWIVDGGHPMDKHNAGVLLRAAKVIDQLKGGAR